MNNNEIQTIIPNTPTSFFRVQSGRQRFSDNCGDVFNTYEEALKHAADIADEYEELYIVQAIAMLGEPKKPVTVTKLV